jgi:hypothetical protein
MIYYVCVWTSSDRDSVFAVCHFAAALSGHMIHICVSLSESTLASECESLSVCECVSVWVSEWVSEWVSVPLWLWDTNHRAKQSTNICVASLCRACTSHTLFDRQVKRGSNGWRSFQRGSSPTEEKRENENERFLRFGHSDSLTTLSHMLQLTAALFNHIYILQCVYHINYI